MAPALSARRMWRRFGVLGVQVVGLSESSVERAQAKAKELRLEKAYPSFDAMVADPQLDVIHITSPNHLHFPQAKAALRPASMWCARSRWR